MELTYIKVFVDYLDAIEPLGDAERGRLFTALLEYGRMGTAPKLDGDERFLFPMMRAQIDRDKASLEAESSSRSEAGKKGAKARWQGYKNDGLDSKAKPGYKNDGLDSKEEDKDKDKEEDKDKEKENTPKPPDAFDEFWAAYPKKKSKGAARKAWDKLKPSPEMRATILRSIERAKQSSDWLEADGKYIPYPATWLNAEGWEDGVEEEQPREDLGKYAKPWPEYKPGMSWEDLIP